MHADVLRGCNRLGHLQTSGRGGSGFTAPPTTSTFFTQLSYMCPDDPDVGANRHLSPTVPRNGPEAPVVMPASRSTSRAHFFSGEPGEGLALRTFGPTAGAPGCGISAQERATAARIRPSRPAVGAPEVGSCSEAT